MCLTVNDNFHISPKKAIIADKDYITYKVLLSYWSRIFTPNQYQEILFNKQGICKRPKVIFSYFYGEIAQGYHSFVKNKRAREYRENFGNLIVPAIIPKGTKFFIGKNGDTVSNEIIYFEDIKKLKEHYPNAGYLSKYYKKFERK